MASYASAAIEDADSAPPGESSSADGDVAENGEEVAVPNLFIQFCLREVGLFLIIVQFLSEIWQVGWYILQNACSALLKIRKMTFFGKLFVE